LLGGQRDVKVSSQTRKNLVVTFNQLTGGASTLLEWDAKIPDFPTLHAEALRARDYIGAQSDGVAEAFVAEAPDQLAFAISDPIQFMIPDAQ